MKVHLLLCFLFVILSGIAQKVHITDMSRDYVRQTNVEGFEYLHDQMDKDVYSWIANIEILFDTIQPKSFKEFYLKMNEKANKLGANAFRVQASNLTAMGETKSIKLEFYFLNYDKRKENKEYFQGQTLYLFGFLGHHRNMEGYKIEINEVKVVLPEQSYIELHPKVGETVSLKLSRGFKTDLIQSKIEVDMFPRYYRFNVYRGVFSRSVIDEHEWSFGEFLVQVLTKRQLSLP